MGRIRSRARNALNSLGWKYKINLHKRYFDIGYGITNYLKFLIALFGAYSFVAKIDMRITLFLAIGYMIFCYALGWWWINRDFYVAEQEVSNQFNLFV